MKNHLLLLLFLITVACVESTGKNHDYSDSDQQIVFGEEEESDYYYENEVTESGFEDGIYTATVYYHNPETDYSATYTLDVEVEDNEVITIYFPKGGYLDEDYIWPAELDDEGYVFIEGEEGKTYEVYLE